MMELFEKQVSSELKYHGIIVDVLLDNAELSDGRIARREVVRHPGGVTVLPVDCEGNCYMVRQFRYPFSKTVLEAPAGKLEYGEDHFECAKRELSEETGFTADEFVDFGLCFTSPGFSSEQLHIYMALGLHEGESHPDDGEFLNVEKHSLDELVQLVMENKIEDAKTAVAILKAKQYLSR